MALTNWLTPSRARNSTCSGTRTASAATQAFRDYDISEVDHLKIDVEGGEEQILIQLINLLQQQKLRVNKTIKYECNFLSDEKLLMNLGKYICKQFGYESEYVCTGWNEDMILRRVG